MPPQLFADYTPHASGSRRDSLLEGLVVREASGDDAEGIALLLIEREGNTPEEAAQRAQRVLSAPSESNRAFVAHVGSRVVGYGRAVYVSNTDQSAPDSAPHGWYMMGVIVTAEFRRRGVGTELTRHRLNWI